MLAGSRRPSRGLVALAAAALGACALPVAVALLFATEAGRAWSEAIATAVAPWERGGWRVLRGGLKWITPPVLAAAVVWAIVRVARQGRPRAALASLVMGGGAFLASEAIKHGLLPFPAYGADGSRNVSGHVAMVASALLVAVTCAPEGARRWVAWIAWALLTGACLGIIASRWHDTGDVVIGLAVAVAWALAGRGVVRFLTAAPDRASGASGSSASGTWAALATAVASSAAAWLLVTVGGAASGESIAQTLGASTLAILAGTIALALSAVAAARAIDAWEGRGTETGRLRAKDDPIP